MLEHVGGLLLRLLLRGGLGVEIGPHGEARVPGVHIVPGKAPVHVQAAHGVAPEADPQNGKGNAVGPGLLPVDLPLVGGDVHPQHRARVGRAALGVQGEALLRAGVGGGGGPCLLLRHGAGGQAERQQQHSGQNTQLISHKKLLFFGQFLCIIPYIPEKTKQKIKIIIVFLVRVL